MANASVTGFGKTGIDADVALSATYTSDWYEVGQDNLFSVHVIISNTDSVGTIAIQGTNFPTNTTNGVTVGFKDENDATQTAYTVSSGTDVDQAFVVYPAAMTAYRWVYTRTSGGSSDTADASALKKRV